VFDQLRCGQSAKDGPPGWPVEAPSSAEYHIAGLTVMEGDAVGGRHSTIFAAIRLKTGQEVTAFCVFLTINFDHT
jgi:hypothetical protein